MRLFELNPTLQGSVADGVLMFDCPFPACQRKHRVRVLISSQPSYERLLRPSELGIRLEPDDWATYPGILMPTEMVKVWQATGEFPDSLTLSPSIDIVELDENGNKIRTLCWHGHVQNGGIT